MLNSIWLGLILAAVLIGGWNGRLPEITTGAFDATKTAVMNVALPLAGIMALWLGIMRLAEKSGFVQVLARVLRPALHLLFPEVPADHPAVGAMVMNIASNMLGLGNASTALGLRAMQHLERLNPRPGTATNAMCTFLAINTSSVQLIPATAVGILAAAGSKNPTAIIGTAFAATCCAALAAIVSVKFLERLPMFALPPAEAAGPLAAADPAALAEEPAVDSPLPMKWWGMPTLLIFPAGFAFCTGRGLLWLTPAAIPPSPAYVQVISALSVVAIPFFLSFFPLYAFTRGVKVYEEFVEGAKEGFQVAVRIIPFLVAILVAVSMFRAAGGIDLVAAALAPLLHWVQFPADLLPIALVRPLSGSATTGLFAELVKAHGPDSFIARTAGTIMGSTETTFYVLAVYFGSVAIRKTRHAVIAGLVADLTGVVVSFAICRAVFGLV